MPPEADQGQRIVQAAAGLFARFGLAKTTMEDIARAAKKGKSSLYYYYNSKEAVFAAVIKAEIEGLKAAIAAAVQQEDDPYLQFRAFVFSRLDYLTVKADQYTTIRDEYLNHYGFIEELTAGYAKWEISAIRQILERGRREKLFAVTDPAITAHAFYLALKGLEYPWATDLKRDEMRRCADTLVDVLLRGISRG